MNKLTKLSNAIIATGLFCAPLVAKATFNLSPLTLKPRRKQMNKTRSLKVHIATAAAAVAVMTIPVLADYKIFKDETTPLS